ncbi:MAG TPA: lipase maturation factor family protein [Lacunisphaera sp.]|nr:lipase maturation factor family protein [Lacunisphaera sp.]
MIFFRATWQQLRSFSGFGGDATYLWPRWIVLRGVGLVYLCIFLGILQEGRALVGPHGLAPIANYCALAHQVLPNVLVRVLHVPSLFLISSHPLVISGLTWVGFGAALALLLNLWPRFALFACWAIFLSFVTTWEVFSPTLNDKLMLETALVCLPFAPAGFRPGLGAASPPRPITVFMTRWLIIRIMLVAGLAKVLGSDRHWLDFTFMERMYETSPAPTVLGYHVFHLPHAFHVGEILLTFAAELVAPILAIFGGRRGRGIAIVTWTIFQAGIQLTGNFGWLNTAAFTLGLMFLDDQMIAAALRRLRLRGWGARVAAVPPAVVRPGRRFVILAAVLWLHFGLTVYFTVLTLRGGLTPGFPTFRASPLEFVFREFRSANCYHLYVSTLPARDDVEFAGTNDRGATWRPYPFRYKPQFEYRMAPFLAPRFGRFEATLQIVLDSRLQVSLIPDVARALVRGDPEVTGLFAGNPFPGAPPTAVRMMVYRYTFTDLKTFRETGRYWNKEYVGDYAPPVSAGRP